MFHAFVELLAQQAPPREPDPSIAVSAPTIAQIKQIAREARGRGSALLSPPQTEGQPEQPQRPSKYLQELYQVLIESIADLLPTNPDDHVVFIPQGELFAVPFPALQDANGRYLIENHTVMTAPSIQVLGLTRRSQQTPSIDSAQGLILGNPTMPMIPALPPSPPRQLSALPESGRERIPYSPYV